MCVCIHEQNFNITSLVDQSSWPLRSINGRVEILKMDKNVSIERYVYGFYLSLIILRSRSSTVTIEISSLEHDNSEIIQRKCRLCKFWSFELSIVYEHESCDMFLLH